MNKKRIGTLIAIAALIVLMSTLGRALYSAPGSEDTGIVTSVPTTERVEAMTTSSVGKASVKTSLPATLEIPELGIKAKVQHLGVTKSGNMAAPKNFTDVSWYKLGTVPGEMGSSVMAGHEDNAISLDGVFKHLEDLRVGDDVFVVREDGKKLHFKVIEKKIYPYNNSPTDRIFNDRSGKYLNLITCAGDWLPEAKTNDKRLVVYTELVE